VRATTGHCDAPAKRSKSSGPSPSGERLYYHGEIFDVPLPGGEGRPIRSLLPPAHIPIYIASLGPANLRVTGELADGWIGTSFFPETAEVFSVRYGRARPKRGVTSVVWT